MTAPSCFVVLNPASGGAHAAGLTVDALADRLRRQGFLAEVVATGRDGTLGELAARASRTQADVLVAAGGDGTVTALAEAAIAGGKRLAVLPLGTANLLARDLGIPLGIEAAIAALPDFEARRIDVATVNGRVFLHKIVIGFAPGIARAREYLRARDGALPSLGFLSFLIRRIDRLRRFHLRIAIDGGAPTRQKVAALTVANNAYVEAPGRVFSRDRLDAGTLTVYVARRITVLDAVRVVGGMFVGNWRRAEAITALEARTLTVWRGRRRFKVMMDGEIETLADPLRFATVPGALEVLAPPHADSEDACCVAAAAAG